MDELEVEDKNARQRLMIVSRNIKCYGEEDIKRAYEEANNIQIKLILLREKEKQLRQRRDELEIRHRDLVKTAEKLKIRFTSWSSNELFSF